MAIPEYHSTMHSHPKSPCQREQAQAPTSSDEPSTLSVSQPYIPTHLHLFPHSSPKPTKPSKYMQAPSRTCSSSTSQSREDGGRQAGSEREAAGIVSTPYPIRSDPPTRQFFARSFSVFPAPDRGGHLTPFMYAEITGNAAIR
jgi:hypothetical protein